MRTEIKERIVAILNNDILLQPVPAVDDDEILGEGGLGIDSLNFLKFMTAVEREFGVKIEDDYWDYERMNTLTKIVDYIEPKL